MAAQFNKQPIRGVRRSNLGEADVRGINGTLGKICKIDPGSRRSAGLIRSRVELMVMVGTRVRPGR